MTAESPGISAGPGGGPAGPARQPDHGIRARARNVSCVIAQASFRDHHPDHDRGKRKGAWSPAGGTVQRLTDGRRGARRWPHRGSGRRHTSQTGHCVRKVSYRNGRGLLVDALGAELDADPRSGRLRTLRNGVLPGALAGAAHHKEVAVAKQEAQRAGVPSGTSAAGGTSAAEASQRRPSRHRPPEPAGDAASVRAGCRATRSPRRSAALAGLSCLRARRRCPCRRDTGRGRPCRAGRRPARGTGHQARSWPAPAPDQAGAGPSRTSSAAWARRRPGHTSDGARPARAPPQRAARTAHPRRSSTLAAPRPRHRGSASSWSARQGHQARSPGRRPAANPGKQQSHHHHTTHTNTRSINNLSLQRRCSVDGLAFDVGRQHPRRADFGGRTRDRVTVEHDQVG